VSGSVLGFALLAGVSMATYTIFLRLASPGIHPALGAAVITGVALLVNGAVTAIVWTTGAPIAVSGRSLALLVVVGVAAAGADLFSLLAYASGLRITSAFIIGGTSAALVLLVGFGLMHEPFSWGKLLAILLIVAGIFLLQREGL
jgi:drug/metabolite transporter (DMT)-like permease